MEFVVLIGSVPLDLDMMMSQDVWLVKLDAGIAHQAQHAHSVLMVFT
jgi:hypothetical protein